MLPVVILEWAVVLSGGNSLIHSIDKEGGRMALRHTLQKKFPTVNFLSNSLATTSSLKCKCYYTI